MPRTLNIANNWLRNLVNTKKSGKTLTFHAFFVHQRIWFCPISHRNIYLMDLLMIIPFFSSLSCLLCLVFTPLQHTHTVSPVCVRDATLAVSYVSIFAKSSIKKTSRKYVRNICSWLKIIILVFDDQSINVNAVKM